MASDFGDMMEVDEEIQQAMLAMSGQPEPPVPNPLQVAQWAEETDYSEKYVDDIYEYRRVTVPRSMLPLLPQGRTMEDSEWRKHGITMSRGWEHYDFHHPEANVLLFRRVLGTDPRTGNPPAEMLAKVHQRMCYIAELEQARQQMIREQERNREQQMADLF
eukprot:TRINITY_DN10815_c1_g1_i1.p2 TRINITY_DN10815_c1_g1~~TRINITY_DN10815_c1_g1_i1.p2  ORF type:complete len:161 (+),score=39.14 TRINITY_DN10815_c1_g1_i1:90-572(+)